MRGWVRRRDDYTQREREREREELMTAAPFRTQAKKTTFSHKQHNNTNNMLRVES